MICWLGAELLALPVVFPALLLRVLDIVGLRLLAPTPCTGCRWGGGAAVPRKDRMLDGSKESKEETVFEKGVDNRCWLGRYSAI